MYEFRLYFYIYTITEFRIVSSRYVLWNLLMKAI